MNTATQRYFWLVTIAVFTLLLVPPLLQDGMFLDGVTYASIARNLAEEQGSAFTLHYTQTLYSNFYEHPPLQFILQSLLFRALGDTIFAERLYTLITAIFSLWAVVLLWKLFTKNTEYMKLSWLPVLLWITVPVVFWSYRNNMLENTLTVFTLFSVYFLLRFIQTNNLWQLFLGCVLILLAFLSKGFVGLFPMAAGGIYYLIFRNSSLAKTIVTTLIFISLPVVLFFSATLVFPDLPDSFTRYFQIQFLPSVNNKREITTGNRLWIFGKLFIELLAPAIAAVLVWFFTQKPVIKNPFRKEAFLFFLIGLSASLPLAITLKQRSYYLVPSVPFYILSISFFISPYIFSLLEKVTVIVQKTLKYTGFLIVMATIVIGLFSFGRFSRDELLLKDIYQMKEHISKGEIISTENLCTNWIVVAYMCRVNYYSLDCETEHSYFIALKNDIVPERINTQYEKSDLSLTYFQLYRKKQ